jgi:magnesium transporter
VLLGMIEDRNSFGARIIPWENALLLVVPAFGDETLNSSAYSASLVLEDLLITLVPSPSERLSEFTQYLRSGINLHKPTISTLVCAQHLFQNDLRVQQAMAVRNRVTALMETLETDAETVTAGDILDLRSQVRVMDADAEEQVYCIELMGPIESPAFSVKGIEDYYQSLLTNARYLDRFTNRLDERGKDLNSQFTLYVQEKTNRKLAVLTVISAIFLPLTLIAGIYGMNFSDMPELGWRHGYPAALLVMGAVAGGLLWVFKRRGWFD